MSFTTKEVPVRQLRISAGIWYLGATSDSFVKQGYRPDKSIEERFRPAAGIPGVQGSRPPEKAIEESICNLNLAYELLDRVPRQELRECFRTSDAIKISHLMRRMLGGKG
jgi:hypothetical protein